MIQIQVNWIGNLKKYDSLNLFFVVFLYLFLYSPRPLMASVFRTKKPYLKV